MKYAVLKIDIQGSRDYHKEKGLSDPDVRKDTLERLKEVAEETIPYFDQPFPDGSFYRAEGDALYLVFRKPTVAIRAAIEFMEKWFVQTLEGWPDCRVLIARGGLQTTEISGRTEVVGEPLEEIRHLEKQVPGGRIYVTESALQAADRTIAHFVFHTQLSFAGREIKLYELDFLDPRTIEDSSLVHALFVAHPESSKARARFYELFLVEYTLASGAIRDLKHLRQWMNEKNYPIGPKDYIEKILQESDYFNKLEKRDRSYYVLASDKRELIEKHRQRFHEDKKQCIELVWDAVTLQLGRQAEPEMVNEEIVERYLSSVFAEIRLLANYFRYTGEFFRSDLEELNRFDYVLRQARVGMPDSEFGKYRAGFIMGLRRATVEENYFIAAVFHNVLATYYLNQATKATGFQRKLLKRREIFLDTNALYASKVKASNWHELISYLLERAHSLGLKIAIFPFTLREYEESLAWSVDNYLAGGDSRDHVKGTWIVKEFEFRSSEYAESIGVCKRRHSIAKSTPIEEENLEELSRLAEAENIFLETDFEALTKEEIDEEWVELRNLMASSSWEMERYWEYIYASAKKPESVIYHDVELIHNVGRRAREAPSD